VIDWDIIGYYSYLPATFIYHDYKLRFVKENPKLAEEHKFWPLIAPNGNYVIKTTMGMSMLYAPFFFLAHIQSEIADSVPNGFSWYYHKYIHLSCLFYLFIGLYFLRKFLLKKFSESVVALTLITIALGTNLFYYATSEAAMSHAYNFSLASVLIYCTSRWYDEARMRYAIFIGLLLGLLTLIRPVNIVFGLFPLLYGAVSWKNIQDNLRLFFIKFPTHTILMALSAFLIFLPQLLYWKSVTGQYLFFSYVGERFFFLRPMILHGMFSFRNGWLIYTPVMFFAIAGLIIMIKQKMESWMTICMLLILYLYLVFSWWCWWYVGFGNRSMIDIYSVLSIPLSVFYASVLHFNAIRKKIFLGLALVLIALNLFQTRQYREGLIHFDSMNFKAYMASFGKLKYSDRYKNALEQPDYKKALDSQ
jgi:hypothetical protein